MLPLLLLVGGAEGLRTARNAAAASASASFLDRSLQNNRVESSCRCQSPNNCTPDCICDCCTGGCVIFPPAPTPGPPTPTPTPPTPTLPPSPPPGGCDECVEPNNCTPFCLCDCCTGECVL